MLPRDRTEAWCPPNPARAAEGFPAELLSLAPESAINRLTVECDWSSRVATRL
jgi:hypothetical protein